MNDSFLQEILREQTHSHARCILELFVPALVIFVGFCNHDKIDVGIVTFLSVIVWTILDFISIKWNTPSYPFHFSLLAVLTRGLVLFSPKNNGYEWVSLFISPLVLSFVKPSIAFCITTTLMVLFRAAVDVPPSIWNDFTLRALVDFSDKMNSGFLTVGCCHAWKGFAKRALEECFVKLTGMLHCVADFGCGATAETPQFLENVSYSYLTLMVLFVLMMGVMMTVLWEKTASVKLLSGS